MSAAVLLALAGDDASLLRALTAPGTGLTVARRCGDLAELLAAAAAGLGQVAVIDCALDQMDLTVLDRLGRAGVRCLLLAPAQQVSQWAMLGAPVEDRAAGAPRLLEAVQHLAQLEAPPGPAPAGESGWPFAEPEAGLGQAQPEPPSAPAPADQGLDGAAAPLVGYPSVGAPGLQPAGLGGAENPWVAGWAESAGAAAGTAVTDVPAFGWAEASGVPAGGGLSVAAPVGDGSSPAPVYGLLAPLPTAAGEPLGGRGTSSAPSGAWPQGLGPQHPGRLVVVWGTAGAPGRSMVAASVAAGLRAVGEVILVDADLEAPSLVQLLGMPEDSSALATAARLATHGGLDQETFRGLLVEVSAGVRLLSGLGRPGRWRELPPVSMEVVWNRCRALADWTVVDVAGGLVEDQVDELTLEPGRGAVVAELLERADVVLVIGGADPVGVRRLLQMLAEVRPQGWHGRLEVVVNRVRASAAGPAPRWAVREALSRFGGLQDVVLLPDDPATADRALLEGRAVLEVAKTSELGKALTELVVRVDPAAAPALRRRRRAGRGLFSRRRSGAGRGGGTGAPAGSGSETIPVPPVPSLGVVPGDGARLPTLARAPSAAPAAGGGAGAAAGWPGTVGDTPGRSPGRHRR